MTKTRLWISPTLELRHAINGWPVAHTEGYAATDLYAEELAKAKAESVPYTIGNEVIINHGGTPDSFIDIDGIVESVWQVRYMPGDKWIDIPNDKKLSDYKGWYSRQVARLKPVDKPVDSGAMSFTEAHVYGVRGPEVPEDIDASKPDSIFTREDVREMRERIKELENQIAQYQEMVGDAYNKIHDGVPTGLKDRILEAFCREYDGESMAYAMLIKVLDDLKIK